MPVCPRDGHGDFRVVRDGVYGKRRRQLFRCVDPETKAFHRFAGPLPRQRAEEGTCDTCDNTVEVHEGPTAMRRSLYETREIAEALVALGRGMTYTDAALRVRGRYWGAGGTGRLRGDASGQTVADWLARYGPVVAEPHAETAWPETVVLDSTEFQYTDRRMGNSFQLFCVLAAWGYETGDTKGRLWRVEARPTDRNSDWEEFLAALPGKPATVVCDRDLAIISGVQRHWGKGTNAVPIHLCEHHLWTNGKKALASDGVTRFGEPLLGMLGAAFTDLAGWNAFATAVNATPNAPTAKRWVAHWDKRMRAQTARRASLPAHYSTGALEPRIQDIRQMLERRSWTFRNRARMNLLLELIRIHLNRQDDPRVYATRIRDHLAANDGQPALSRAIYDTRGADTLRV